MLEALELKRIAIQIVSQLPPDNMEALAVLGYARELVEKWLCQSADILEFREPVGSSPRAVATRMDKPAPSP